MKGIHIFPLSIVGSSFLFFPKRFGGAMHGHSQEGTKQNFVSIPF